MATSSSTTLLDTNTELDETAFETDLEDPQILPAPGARTDPELSRLATGYAGQLLTWGLITFCVVSATWLQTGWIADIGCAIGMYQMPSEGARPSQLARAWRA